MACAAAANMDPQWLDTVFRDIVKSTAQYRLGAFSKHFDVGHIIEVNITGKGSVENHPILGSFQRPSARYPLEGLE